MCLHGYIPFFFLFLASLREKTEWKGSCFEVKTVILTTEND